jgi:hypothetical protein
MLARPTGDFSKTDSSYEEKVEPLVQSSDDPLARSSVSSSVPQSRGQSLISGRISIPINLSFDSSEAVNKAMKNDFEKKYIAAKKQDLQAKISSNSVARLSWRISLLMVEYKTKHFLKAYEKEFHTLLEEYPRKRPSPENPSKYEELSFYERGEKILEALDQLQERKDRSDQVKAWIALDSVLEVYSGQSPELETLVKEQLDKGWAPDFVVLWEKLQKQIEKDALEGKLSYEEAQKIDEVANPLFSSKFRIQDQEEWGEDLNVFLLYSIAHTNDNLKKVFFTLVEQKKKCLTIKYSNSALYGFIDYLKNGTINNFIDKYSHDENAILEFSNLAKEYGFFGSLATKTEQS